VNLVELRNRVKQVTDFAPELGVYNEALDLLINDAYMALWTEKRWKFAQKTTFIDIWPDLVASQPNLTTVNANVVSNRRAVSFSGAVLALASYPYQWEGQIIEINGRDYFIDQVLSSTSIRLREPYRGLPGAVSNWRMKHRFYDLPSDAIELLGLIHKDTPAVGKIPPYGPVRGITCRREEDLNLREDLTSFYSQAYIPYGTSNVPPAETFTFETQGITGTIPNGTFLEFCWSFETDGGKKVGALSESKVASVTVGGPSGIRITFKTFDNVDVAAPAYADPLDQTMNQFEGLRKRLYFNQNFNRATGVRLSGLPVWREVTLGTTAVVPGVPGLSTAEDPARVGDTASTYTVASLAQVNPGNKRYIDYDGLHLRFRPYPRPIGSDFVYQYVLGVADASNDGTERQFRQWECRYYRKPQRLGLQTDTPELPIEFHNLIVYKALHDIFSKHDSLSQAQSYQRKYDTELKRLEKRYVDSIDMELIRGQFGTPGRRYSPFDPNSLKRMN
jgi:hypothetical protein